MSDLEKLDKIKYIVARAKREKYCKVVTIEIDDLEMLIEIVETVAPGYRNRPRIIARSSNGDVKTTYLDELFKDNA